MLLEHPGLVRSLHAEFKERKLEHRSAADGWKVEDERREERYQVDVWAKTGTKLSKRSARVTQSRDDDLVLVAAEALHEKWRSTLPKAAVWLTFKENEEAFHEWFDPRFHEIMVWSNFILSFKLKILNTFNTFCRVGAHRFDSDWEKMSSM